QEIERRPGGAPRGVYVDGGMYVDGEGALPHPESFYFRQVRPWQRTTVPSSDTVYRFLTDPAEQRPVLMSDRRYQAFRDDVGKPRGLPTTPMAVFHHSLLLLPGPYAACAPEVSALRDGGR